MNTTFTASGKSIADGASKRLAYGRCNGESHLGVTVKADQALSVAIAYGRLSDLPSVAAEDATSGGLPYATAATIFASEASSTEGGTQHNLALPPQAEIYQLILSNNSGSTASVTRVDWALQDNVAKEQR